MLSALAHMKSGGRTPTCVALDASKLAVSIISHCSNCFNLKRLLRTHHCRAWSINMGWISMPCEGFSSGFSGIVISPSSIHNK